MNDIDAVDVRQCIGKFGQLNQFKSERHRNEVVCSTDQTWNFSGPICGDRYVFPKSAAYHPWRYDAQAARKKCVGCANGC